MAVQDTDQVRVGIIGYGLAGEVFHAPLIDADPRLRVAAVVTTSADRAERALRRYPGVRVHAGAEDLLAAPEQLDLVVVAAPNKVHTPLTRDALRAGLPVVVDKPFTLTAGDAAELIALAEQRGLLLSVFHNRRWDGDFLTVRRLVGSGELGTVTRFESRFERWRPTVNGGWREAGGADEGAGLLFDLGSHLVDQALALFGPPTGVYAELDRRRDGVRADDDAFVALTHAGGVRSHLWMSAVAGQLGPRFRVLGSTAAYVKYGLDVQEDQLRAGGAPTPDRRDWGAEDEQRHGLLGSGEQVRAVATERGSYQLFYAGIAAALLDGAPVPVDPRDAARTVSVLESARHSALNQ